MSRWDVVRKQPYTDAGVRRLLCVRCQRNPARYQWQICSDGNNFRPLCSPCDVLLNQLVLEFMMHPKAKALVEGYRETGRDNKEET